ncbi:MAG: cobalamin B12-binding domain-containing protein [Chloroflexi bacterium]|nr:cobalamin B12-binding domain-containing protein [Chloroflexota bacterium]
MKILLIQPDSSQKMVGFSKLILPEPLALEIMAACLPEHETKILDLRVDPTLDETVKSFGPDLVGITGYTTYAPRMLDICRRVKAMNPHIRTVLGGYHASLCPEDFDEECVDVIVVGEGEVTFRELVTALQDGKDLSAVQGIIYRQNGRRVATPWRPLITNLNALPLPARTLTDHYRPAYHFHFWEGTYLVETARGCPYRCTFCAVWKFHQGKCRVRTPERVVREIESCDTEIICIVDDNFLQSLHRAEKIGDLIAEHGIKKKYWMQARADSIVRRPDLIAKWAKLGLRTILIGFEKFREEELASVNKSGSIKANEKAMEIMREYDVDMWGAFIVDPAWTRSDFDAAIDYVRSMKITFPQFTVLTPLPGTDFFREKLDQLITRNYEIFDFLHTVLPTKLPIDEFYANMARLYSSTTLSLSDLKRKIRAGQIPLSALERVRGLLADVTDPQAYLRSVGDLDLTRTLRGDVGAPCG